MCSDRLALADFYQQMGRRIAVRRHAASLTQEALAGAAGIGASYLAHIEAGRRKPTLDVLHRIAVGLSIEAWQLLTDSTMSADDRVWRARERKLAEKVQPLGREDLDLLIAMATKLAHRKP
jgi:transcriptional regulator with XRE-family HTH domain